MVFCGCCIMAGAQDEQKSALQKQAEAAKEKGSVATSRYTYIRAYEDYLKKGQNKQALECAAKATALYYTENLYQEAFDFLRNVDQNIQSLSLAPSEKATLHYVTSKERMKMYMRMRRPESTRDHLKAMENYAAASSDESVKNDILYEKAIYHYTFGQIAQGNAVFKEMAAKLTASKEYDKVEAAYKQMIANGQEAFLEMMPFYQKDNVFYIPECARWDFIMKNAKQPDIAIKIDTALHEIEMKKMRLMLPLIR